MFCLLFDHVLFISPLNPSRFVEVVVKQTHTFVENELHEVNVNLGTFTNNVDIVHL